tara:strand:+ start:89 stop:427 length:339 start_codon:yes stop_codon:yes gene_type:complete
MSANNTNTNPSNNTHTTPTPTTIPASLTQHEETLINLELKNSTNEGHYMYLIKLRIKNYNTLKKLFEEELNKHKTLLAQLNTLSAQNTALTTTYKNCYNSYKDISHTLQQLQ